jgi:hypothetical protein
MIYLSHAHLKPGAVPSRVKALKHDLEAYGCTVHVHYGARRVDVCVDAALERWIVLSGLARLFANHKDIVDWRPNFSINNRGVKS